MSYGVNNLYDYDKELTLLGTKLECRAKKIPKPKTKKNESSVQNV
jgi:hypothetical protein